MKTSIISILLLGAGTAGGYFLGLGKGKDGAGEIERARYEQMLVEKQSLMEKEKASLVKQAEEKARADVANWVPMPEQFKDASLDTIFDSPGPMGRFQAIMSYIQDMDEKDIPDELDKIRDKMRGGFDAEKMFAMHLMLTRYGSENFEGAVKYLDGQDMWTQGMGKMTVLSAAASTDPKKAVDYLKGEGSMLLNLPRIGGFAAGGVAKEWAKNDPDGALDWAKNLPDSARGGALGQVVGGIAMEDPRKAAGIVMEMNEGKDRTDLVGNVAGKWAATNPQEALAWANGLENPDEKRSAQKSALGGWADQDPAAAAKQLASFDGVDQQEGVGVVGSRWARKEPAVAAEWVAQQEGGSGKTQAMGDVMRNWTASEPEKASQWLTTQESGPGRDNGIVGLADTIGPSDPDASMEWVASISDADKRTNELKNRTKIWMNIDSEGATNWIQNSGSLNADEKATLLGR
jgi:hypothetical protein